jgi:hypothetical protein
MTTQAVDVPAEVARAIAAARAIRRTAQAIRDASGPVRLLSLARRMGSLQTQFVQAMTALATLATVRTDAEIAALIGAQLVLPADAPDSAVATLADPVAALGTPVAPGPILLAGAAMRIAWERDVLPAIGAVEAGDGKLRVPGLVWNLATSGDEDLDLTQAQIAPLTAVLPELIAVLEVFA